MIWTIARRRIELDRHLVMGILNVTPDSFSDGGQHLSIEAALDRAQEMIGEGADIIDIGGESTRPGSSRIPAEQEIARVVPVIKGIHARHPQTTISIDTTKSQVACAALKAGAGLINDISGLRWDRAIADVAAESGAGLILMHSRGDFETMHSQPPVDDILQEVTRGLRSSIDIARQHGVADEQICLDIGIGFGKALDQNLELIAQLDKIVAEFADYPLLVGTSRKSFLGKLRGGVPPDQRLGGSLATAIIAAQKGARILRVHDVKDTVDAIAALKAIERV